jgi:hypothetical protein
VRVLPGWTVRKLICQVAWGVRPVVSASDLPEVRRSQEPGIFVLSRLNRAGDQMGGISRS